MVVTITVSDRLRIPKGVIPDSVMKKRYHLELFIEEKCINCENYQDRSPHNELCKSCKNFDGVYNFYDPTELKQDKIWSVPQADELAVKTYLDKEGIKYKWKDNRKVFPFDTNFKFTQHLYTKDDLDDDGNPRPDQQKAVEKWLSKLVGVITAPPRSGKTAMATACYCELGVKTVIIADKKELLNQFYETACGVPAPKYVATGNKGHMQSSTLTAGRKGMTNIPKLQKKTGREIIFMPSSYANLKAFIKKRKEIPDVLLITYQSFARDLSRTQKIINKYYSLAVIDEEHGAAATKYLQFVASLKLKYRLGLSATPDRKDARSKLTKLVFGPVVATIRTTTLKPIISFKLGAEAPKTPHKSWGGASGWIKRSKKRNDQMVAQAFADMRSGHNAIIIPVDTKAHMNYLVKRINHQAALNNKKRGENWPTTIARPYHSGIKDRVKVLSWVDQNKDHVVHKDYPTRSPRILVAIRSMVKQGIDLKRPSAIYIVEPMSASKTVGAPMFRQLSMRVGTPFKDKPKPICRVWVDPIGMFVSCAQGLLFNEILPRSTMSKNPHPQYTLSKSEYDSALSIFNTARAISSGSASKKSKAVNKNGAFW